MPFYCKSPTNHIGKIYGSGKNRGECATFVQTICQPQMPLTGSWKQGRSVKLSRPGEILPGTAIATFLNGGYPKGKKKHAAVYLGHDHTGIQVIDAWAGQPGHARTIKWGGNGISNDGNFFYVVEQ